jgi:hypothetical protein
MKGVLIEQKIASILEACNDRACGGHFSGRLTRKKVMQSKYFWPTMFFNPHDHVKRCDACQCYARNNIHMELP